MHEESNTPKRQRGPQPKSLADLFWVYVEKTPGCWFWTGSIDGNGYGIVSRRPADKGSRLAHRVAWELICGPIPERTLVRHLCARTNCVNPEHLALGNWSDNLRDRYRHGRSSDRPSPRPKQIVNPRVERVCPTCGVIFLARPSNVARGNAKYCSRPCYRILLRDRFWQYVEKTESCWLWKGATGAGYGRIVNDHWDGQPKRILIASRVSWEMHFGPIRTGLFVLHRCDNRACVRPDHLFLGSHRDNMRDCAAKKRTALGARNGWYTKPESNRIGERHPAAKLTEAIVRDWRQRHAAGGVSYTALAAEGGVGVCTAKAAIDGKTWQHVK